LGGRGKLPVLPERELGGDLKREGVLMTLAFLPNVIA
jgi:hypothetical protein